MCGLRVSVQDGRVTEVRGNADDVWSGGHICPKGAAIGQLHEDPDRLRVPMVRTPEGTFREVDAGPRPTTRWSGSCALCSTSTGHKRSRSTSEIPWRTISVWPPTSVPSSAWRVRRACGAYYSPGTVDQWPLNVVGTLVFGGMWNAPIPDLSRTDHLVILGANPAVSQGSMLSAPDVMGRLAAIRRRNGRVVVVDPRRTPTAARASEWVPIRPGTDALLLFALLAPSPSPGPSVGRRTSRQGAWARRGDRARRALHP